jgi:4-amino-4-deoxychorismate lyase
MQYRKLNHDCSALNIPCPEYDLLNRELESLSASHPDAVFKIIVTRGQSARGYAPDASSSPTHVWDAMPLPSVPEEWINDGVKLCVCSLRLARQPRLAGIKHLNRLENVLAAAELGSAAEGIMLDTEGLVIEGVRSNLFTVKGGMLITPDLSRCGVAGVMRDRVLDAAHELGIKAEVRDVHLEEILEADELFLTNSVFGLLFASSLNDRNWTDFPVAARMRRALERSCNG